MEEQNNNYKIYKFDIYRYFKKIDPFKMDEMRRNPFGMDPIRVFMIAKPKSGKSYTLRDFMYKLRHYYSKGAIFSETELTNSFYKQFFPRTYVFDGFDEDIILQIMKSQKILMKQQE